MGTGLLSHRFTAVMCLVIVLHATVAVQLAEGHVAMFVFGDSLYDPGNNNYIKTIFKANFPPYGQSYFQVPTGRFSDGRLIPDFISEYAKLPLIPEYLNPGVHNYVYGVNFASGGAGALVETHKGLVVDLKTQLRYFRKVEKKLKRKLGTDRSKALIYSAVYLLSIGVNDYSLPFTTKYSKQEYISMVLGNITQVIQGMYAIGARKFGFVMLPPVGCFPGTRLLVPEHNGACLKKSNQLAKMHNKQLNKILTLTQTRLTGFNYSLHNMYTSITQRLKSPSKYGFKVADQGCYRGKSGVEEFDVCEDVSDYFFFDSAHPSQKAYNQLSELMWGGDSHLTKPYNLRAFFEH